MALKVTKQMQTLSASSATPHIAKVSCMAVLVRHRSMEQMHIAARVYDIQQVLAVFPFFQVDLTNRQQKMMHTLTRMPRVMGVVGAILGALPLALQRWLVNWWGGTDCHPVLLDVGP